MQNRMVDVFDLGATIDYFLLIAVTSRIALVKCSLVVQATFSVKFVRFVLLQVRNPSSCAILLSPVPRFKPVNQTFVSKCCVSNRRS